MLLSLLCGPLAWGAADEKLIEAEKFYRAGEWEKARVAYGEIASSGAAQLPSSLYYNLGTASLRAGATGAAYAYLLKALSSRPLDSDALQNLRLAEIKMSAAVRAVRPASWISGWPLPAHFFLAGFWLLPLLICSAGWMRAATSSRGRKRVLGWAVGTTLALALAIVGYQQSSAEAAAVVKSAQVKSGPASTYPDIVGLEAGSVVNTEERREGWTKIRFTSPDQSESVGWIEATALLAL